MESTHQHIGPGGLPLIDAGLEIQELDLHGGAQFWDEVRAFSARGFGEAFVREMLARREPPRVWLFLGEPGVTEPRIVAMLAVARALQRLGQVVLVVDGDDQHPDLTRWTGRHEREGWIDFIRYGASLPTCSIPLPWDGESGRLMGVGSFVPTSASEFEIDWLLSLLGSQADHVLVAAPLGQHGQKWLGPAHLRLLCWDRTTHDDEDVEGWARGAEAAGKPLHAVIAFGSRELALLPPPDGSAAEPAVELAAQPADAPPDLIEICTSIVAELPSLRHDQADGPEPAEATSAAAEGAPAGVSAAPPAPHAVRRSSRVFVRMTIALLVVLIVLGAWWLKVLREPLSPTGGSDLASERVERDILLSTDSSGPEGVAPERTGEDVSEVTQAAPGPGEEAAAPAVEPTATAQASATRGPEPAAAPPSRTEATTAASGVFDPAPYRVPVGQAGWALHVYSLPDSAQANRQIADLQRRGLQAVWRAIELPGKGRWYRICLGSFPSQEAALRAKPALLARLRENWAQPVQF